MELSKGVVHTFGLHCRAKRIHNSQPSIPSIFCVWRGSGADWAQRTLSLLTIAILGLRVSRLPTRKKGLLFQRG